LYHNISTGEDLDLTGNGLLDLEEGLIKTCSSPDIIFTDDPLRIMRAIRFSSKLGFRIDDDVLKGMKDNAERLKIISQERITDEFNKILTSKDPHLGLTYLNGIKFFEIISPYLFVTEKGKYDAFNAIYEFQDNEKYKLETALAVLLKSWYSGDSNRNLFLHNFKYSNDMIKIVNLYSSESWHVELACALNLPNKVREIIHKCATVEDFENIVAIAKATRNIGPRSDGREIFDVLNDIDVPEMIGYKLPVNGDDIMEILQIGPSPLIKKVFDVLIEEAYENPKITKEECVAIVEEFKPGTEFIDTTKLTGNSLTLKK
jgi:tRNA nucleotidyltransferase/poly(A) polymerase